MCGHWALAPEGGGEGRGRRGRRTVWFGRGGLEGEVDAEDPGRLRNEGAPRSARGRGGGRGGRGGEGLCAACAARVLSRVWDRLERGGGGCVACKRVEAGRRRRCWWWWWWCASRVAVEVERGGRGEPLARGGEAQEWGAHTEERGRAGHGCRWSIERASNEVSSARQKRDRETRERSADDSEGRGGAEGKVDLDVALDSAGQTE